MATVAASPTASLDIFLIYPVITAMDGGLKKQLKPKINEGHANKREHELPFLTPIIIHNSNSLFLKITTHLPNRTGITSQPP